MEFELKEKTKVDRGLLNTWYSEVQRTKVKRILIINQGKMIESSRMKRKNIVNVVIQLVIMINNFV
jgi:(2Fe-2S) ferredoxin